MPIDTYLNQQVQIKSKTGFDKYGKPTTGSASTIEARFLEKQNIFKDDNGKEYTTDAELWILPTQTITLEDVITVNSINYKVARIDARRDINGSIDHRKAFLIKTKE